MSTCSETPSHCLSCRIEDGTPTMDRRDWGYYSSRNGVRMLVVEQRADERIRINDTIEVVVLETGKEDVRLGIDQVAGPRRRAGASANRPLDQRMAMHQSRMAQSRLSQMRPC